MSNPARPIPPDSWKRVEDEHVKLVRSKRPAKMTIELHYDGEGHQLCKVFTAYESEEILLPGWGMSA